MPNRPKSEDEALVRAMTRRRSWPLLLLLAALSVGPLAFAQGPAASIAFHPRPLGSLVHQTAIGAAEALHREEAFEAEVEPIDVSATRFVSPAEWMTSRNRRCSRYRGRRFCDGPLRVAKPDEDTEALAEQLGLGTIATASHLLKQGPRPEWIDAVEGEASDRLAWPVEGGVLWRGFGRTRKVRRGKIHKGLDIGATPGTRVRAVSDGLVAYSHFEVRGYGNLIMLIHPDGAVSYYAHLKAAYVGAGQRVRRGDVIGEVGETGLARGPHLHFEWRVGGRARNPLPRMDMESPADDAPAEPEGDFGDHG